MKVRVVTPTLGRSRWLAEAVDSVRKAGDFCEHVLVAPAETIPDLRSRFPHCRVVREADGGGMYGAINAGLLAPGVPWEAFTYLNDDDLLLPGFSHAAARLRPQAAAGALAFVYGIVRLVNADGRDLGRIPVSRFPSQNRALYAERLEPVYQHGTLVTRATWQKHGGFDESYRYCGDSEFFARLCVGGVNSCFVPVVVAAFRLHPDQLTKRRGELSRERERVDRQLGLREGPSGVSRRIARGVFRVANARIYLDRISRHGWKSFDEILSGST